MHYTTIDPKKSKIGTHDYALHHHWSPKDKNLNPRPCATPPFMTPEKTKIQTHDMHYTTIDSQKVKDSNPRHALHCQDQRKNA
jgi:hypothetical protein